VGALDPSLTGKLAPGTSGAGIGETFGCDEGIVGIEEADCVPGTLENENSSLTVGKDGAPASGEFFAPSRKYADAPGTAGGFAEL